MTKFIYSYNRFSEGAKLLAETMGIKRIRHINSRYRHRRGNQIINWGSSTLPDALWPEGEIVSIWNDPEFVKICSNKLKFFEHMHPGEGGIDDGADWAPRLPEFTTDTAVAKSWHDAGAVVVARQKLNGHSAEGLYIMDPQTPEWAPNGLLKWYDAPLYTKYVKKQDEYRIHIVGGKVIDVQKKAKRRDFEGEHNHQVRNLANGYIYMRENVVAPDDVIEQALRGMRCSGLDFGACDVLWNNHYQQAYLLEINTAPGLSGSTLTAYAEALRMY